VIFDDIVPPVQCITLRVLLYYSHTGEWNKNIYFMIFGFMFVYYTLNNHILYNNLISNLIINFKGCLIYMFCQTLYILNEKFLDIKTP